MNSISLIKPAAKMATQVLAQLIHVNEEGVTSEAVSQASVMIAGGYNMLLQLDDHDAVKLMEEVCDELIEMAGRSKSDYTDDIMSLIYKLAKDNLKDELYEVAI